MREHTCESDLPKQRLIYFHVFLNTVNGCEGQNMMSCSKHPENVSP